MRKLAYGFNALKPKTGSVTRTFKQTTVAQKVLELQYSIYNIILTTVIATCHKILVLVVQIIEMYNLIPFAKNHPSIEAFIH